MGNAVSSADIILAKRKAVRAVYLSLSIIEKILKHSEFYGIQPPTRERLNFVVMILREAFDTLSLSFDL